MRERDPYFGVTIFFMAVGLLFVVIMAWRALKFPGFAQ